MAITTSTLTPFMRPCSSSSFFCPSGLISARSKSNSTSVEKVTFSATGLGAGFGASIGAARGVGAGAGAGAGGGFGASGFGVSLAQPATKASATSRSQVLRIIVRPSRSNFLDRILP